MPADADRLGCSQTKWRPAAVAAGVLLALAIAALSLSLVAASSVALAKRYKCHGVRAIEVGTKGSDNIRTGRGRDVIVARGGND